MEFTNTFTVNVPLDRVWEHMLDAEKVTPCVPGAQLTETIDARHFKGTIKVKLGAVQMSYRGQLEMEPDEESHTILLRAKGTETRGSGGATGVVTTRLSSDADGATTVVMESHVDVTGRVAQFGRGIMQDVANRLVKDFARCLETHLTEEQEAATSGAVEPETSAPRVEVPAAATAKASSDPPSVATRVPQPPPATAPAPTRPAAQATALPATAPEIRPMELLVEIVRSRLAELLRMLADRVEPKS